MKTFAASAHERSFVRSTAMETANACSPGPVLKSDPITRSVMLWMVGHGNCPCFRIAKIVNEREETSPHSPALF